MTTSEAEKIIENEGLENYNWYDEREVRPDEIGIEKFDGQWIVYTADERAVVKSELSYPTEALEDFIERLRADKILREL
ncbi:hypothetical protein ACFFJY_18010 [Fictibacillus aquaticus]|uniref:Uncharacterized protein n=1 Tax=Fictibacillus aquaticus TaxID=2021314 RepID=A0A235F5Q9_9BACL|nr:hypothetical protein [Fictibacillus aquaticus]OYD56562.1 hypothetical protein CGZ90_16245 [Fictibacillus aquaticus]